MSKRKPQFDFWTIVTIGILAVFALFLIYPLISLFVDGFLEEGTGAFTMANFTKFFGKKFYYRSLLNSLKLTVCVTICSLLIGVPLAYIMSFFKIRGKGVIEILIIISMMSPNFIGAYSWILLLGRSGVVTQFLSNTFGIQMPSIYGFGGMLLVFTLKLYPFIYMYVSGALKKVDVAVCEAAESLGCNAIRKVFTVVMPLVTPTAIASALLVFMNCMADFGTPALIGEGYDVLPTKIYIEFVGESGGSAYFASAMASLMVVITAVLFLLQKWYVNKKSFTMSAMRPIQPTRAKGAKNVLMHVFTYLLVILSVVPHLVIVWTSLRKTEVQYFVDGYSFESYTKIFDTAFSSIQNTYLYRSGYNYHTRHADRLPLGAQKEHADQCDRYHRHVPLHHPRLGAWYYAAFGLQRQGRPAGALRNGHHHDHLAGDPPPGLHAAFQFGHPLPDQPQRGRSRHLPGRFSAEGVCEGNGQIDAARRDLRRHSELDYAHQRAELLGHALYSQYAHHVRGHLQRGYPRQLWHGRRAGHHPDADDGAVAVPVLQDQRKQGRDHVACPISPSEAYA